MEIKRIKRSIVVCLILSIAEWNDWNLFLSKHIWIKWEHTHTYNVWCICVRMMTLTKMYTVVRTRQQIRHGSSTLTLHRATCKWIILGFISWFQDVSWNPPKWSSGEFPIHEGFQRREFASSQRRRRRIRGVLRSPSLPASRSVSFFLLFLLLFIFRSSLLFVCLFVCFSYLSFSPIPSLFFL